MTPQRYLAVIRLKSAPPINVDADRGAILPALLPLRASPSLTIWTKPGVEALAFPDASGSAIGTVFERGHAKALTKLPGWFGDTPIEEREELLTSRFWGGYVAFWSTGDRVTVLRDPSGAVPCYYVRQGHHLLVASDVAMLRESHSYQPEIDWSALTEQLIAIQYRTGKTCLSSVRELSQGSAIISDGMELNERQCWSPWTFGRRNRLYSDTKHAASDLRDTVEEAVRGWSSRITRPLLPLSGGLDSSILAAALHNAGATADGLTISTEAAAGDERVFARSVSSVFSMVLHEEFYDVSIIDLERSAAAHLPRPSARAFGQELDRLTQAVAAQSEADGVMHGGGGDNVFCSLQSIAPLLDTLAVQGLGSASLHIALDICRLTGASLATVLTATARRLVSRRRRYRWLVDTTLLSPAAVHATNLRFDHPWLIPPRDALAGTAAHIGNLLAIQNYLEAHFQHPELATVAPLLSQPIVELCLQIPSWMWVSGGIDRAVARHAFSDVLPPAITRRRTKGSPDSVVIDLLETNRSLIRLMLTDGLLAQHGLLDRTAIDTVLGTSAPLAGEMCSRILTLCDAEAWARSMRGDSPAYRR